MQQIFNSNKRFISKRFDHPENKDSGGTNPWNPYQKYW